MDMKFDGKFRWKFYSTFFRIIFGKILIHPDTSNKNQNKMIAKQQQKTLEKMYIHLPKGAKWFLKGVN